MKLTQDLVNSLLELTKQAGDAIMEVYNSDDFGVEHKDDEINSPLTKADIASHNILMAGLQQLTPEIPIVSEEADKDENLEAAKRGMYWIIDPLDGTKEFIKRGGDFTVNIGMVVENSPIYGFIYVPAKKEYFWTGIDGAYKKYEGGEPEEIKVSNSDTVTSAVASKSHFDDTTASFLGQFGEIEFVQAGSSLKLCLVAEGKAEIYPRFAPTMEWDTAAGDAIVRKAGGKVVDTQTKETLKYGKENFYNHGFVVSAENLEYNF